jgi:hypothetical protein
MKGDVAMNSALGAMKWLIPDGFYPSLSSPGHYVSHEAVCVLNTGDKDADIRITLYFEDREPVGFFKVMCGARRTNHVRLDKLADEAGNGVPKDTCYAMLVESNVPVVVQYSRLDTTQPEMSLMTTMAHPV